MANIALEDFVGAYRDELIRRCHVKVAARVSPEPEQEETLTSTPAV